MKKEKQKYIDDGHTIYNMDVDGFKWHDKKVSKDKQINVTKKERNALIKAAYLAFIPKFLIILLAFGLAIFLVYLWLN